MSPTVWRAAFWTAWAVVSVLSLLPGRAELPVFAHADKLGHFTAYAVLGGLSAGGYPRWRWQGASGLIAWGLLLELLQQYVPLRSLDVLDFCANSAGVLTGLLLARAAARG